MDVFMIALKEKKLEIYGGIVEIPGMTREIGIHWRSSGIKPYAYIIRSREKGTAHFGMDFFLR